jgi:hypothetical protein
MDEEPVVVGEDERDWEALGDEEASDSVLFKTLISEGLTRSEALTTGVAKVPPARRSPGTATGRPRSTSCSRALGRSG